MSQQARDLLDQLGRAKRAEDVSYADLARRIGRTPAAVTSYMRHGRRCHLQAFIDLAGVLGYEVVLQPTTDAQ